MYTQPEKVIDVCEITNLQKSHDFQLSEPIRDDIKYIVQTRTFEDAFISYYRLERLKYATQTEEKDPAENKPHVDVLSNDYIAFRSEAKAYYEKFLSKWVDRSLPNALIIEYEKLLMNPLGHFQSVISFICDEEIDLQRLEKSVL